MKLRTQPSERATLYNSVEHCVRMVLTVEERPSSTRLSRWVWVSVSISSLVCSSVLLSIRAKHLHKHSDRFGAQLCTCQRRSTAIPTKKTQKTMLHCERRKVNTEPLTTTLLRVTVWLAKLSLPVQKLENKVFKLRCGKTQILLHLGRTNRNDRWVCLHETS